MTATDQESSATNVEPIWPVLLTLDGGEFIMGRDDRRPDERPAHPVRLRPFRAAVDPVTNAEWERFVAAGGPASRFADDPNLNGGDQPVVGVSWHDAQAYCDWLTECGDTTYRLPTEAEREYAAAAGRRTDWPWGDADPANHAPQAFVARATAPHPPQDACANGFGLRCMAENVHEWCTDFYARDGYTAGAASAIDDPRGPTSGVRRASRGGSWRHKIKFTRVTARSSLDPGFRYNDYGFRVYADAP